MRRLAATVATVLVVAGAPFIRPATATPSAPTFLSLGATGGDQATAPHLLAPLTGGGLGFAGFDLKVRVWQPGSAAAVDLGLSLSGVYADLVPLDGGAFAFAVPEAANGHTDRNGDGDTDDSVVFVWDPRRGTVNLRLAVETVNVCCSTDTYNLAAVPGGDVAFLVPEAGQGGADRNGDGDTSDSVVAVWDHTTGAVSNAGLDATTVDGLSDGRLAALTSESGQGRTDLNGDGDTNDKVAQVWGRATALLNTQTAALGVVASAGGRMAVLVPEAAQGNADRNGDGDTGDTVVAIWDPARPATVTNLGLAQGNTETNVVALERGHLAIKVSEADQEQDLNGDGDQSDRVVEIWNPATGNVTNLHQRGTDLVALAGGGLAFEASDLMVWRPDTNVATSPGVHNNGIALAMPDGRVAYGLAEFGQRKDLNGDGDKTDHYIPSIWDPATNQTGTAGVVGEGLGLSSGAFVIGVSEPSEGFDVAGNGNGDDPGVDLNGDGDGTDSVLFLWDGSGVRNLRVDGAPLMALDGNRFVAVDSARRLSIVSVDPSSGSASITPQGGTTSTTGPTTNPTAPTTSTTQPPAPGPTTNTTLPPATGPAEPRPDRVTDRLGDVTDPDGRPVTEPRADLVGASATFGPQQTALSVQTAQPVSPLTDVNWSDGASFVGWAFDSDRNGEPDRLAVLATIDGRLQGAVSALSDPSTILCWATPTSAAIGDNLSLVVDTACLGGPSEGNWAAFLFYNQGGPGSDGPVALDFAPDDGADAALTTARSAGGYWLVSKAGDVYPFGDVDDFGGVAAETVDIEPTPSNSGYWILGRDGRVFAKGNAPALGNAALPRGVNAVSLSATPSGRGYWIFTDKGGVFAFGDAPVRGDMIGVKLNGPVLGSVATPSGRGYWMVASDGGIFAFGDAVFSGSMGGRRLNRPVMSMAPDPDGAGYWLVASDGGIFAFDAPFYGSTGNLKLSKPISGMVPGTAGYLMVAGDGGIFAFGDVPFHGSLGADPPPDPIVAVALAKRR